MESDPRTYEPKSDPRTRQPMNSYKYVRWRFIYELLFQTRQTVTCIVKWVVFRLVYFDPPTHDPSNRTQHDYHSYLWMTWKTRKALVFKNERRTVLVVANDISISTFNWIKNILNSSNYDWYVWCMFLFLNLLCNSSWASRLSFFVLIYCSPFKKKYMNKL